MYSIIFYSETLHEVEAKEVGRLAPEAIGKLAQFTRSATISPINYVYPKEPQVREGFMLARADSSIQVSLWTTLLIVNIANCLNAVRLLEKAH